VFPHFFTILARVNFSRSKKFFAISGTVKARVKSSNCKTPTFSQFARCACGGLKRGGKHSLGSPGEKNKGYSANTCKITAHIVR